MQAQARGEAPPRFETADYRSHRATALRAAGLDDEANDAEHVAAAEQEIADAQRALGTAIVDETSGAAGRKRLDAARSEIEALDHAELELRRRDEAEERVHAEGHARAARKAAYEWMVHYLTEAAATLQARAQLIEAEARLRNVGTSGFVNRIRLNQMLDEESGLDLNLLRAIPRENTRTPAIRLGGDTIYAGPFGNTEGLTVERCTVLRERAERLACETGE